ncbi:MAG TPA: AAA family ATPase [Bradyrhizobium sp.]|nr:AAA family ATPase [Bradyrhizobium sp.]
MTAENEPGRASGHEPGSEQRTYLKSKRTYSPKVWQLDAPSQFLGAIRSAGLVPPNVVVSDGKLHRFASNGKRGDDAGWYIFHDDSVPAGAFGDWRTGLSETWHVDIGRRLSPGQETALRARVEAMRREREVEDAKAKAEAREKATAIWQAAETAPEDHPYLVKKSVKAHGLRIHDGKLVIPMSDDAGLHSLQFIAIDGDKRFLPGGRVSGCYFIIGESEGALCIAEGYATAASIHEATGFAVAVAFNATNLLPAARALRTKFPSSRIIVCADDDAATEGNPGLTRATAAALAVNGLLVVPDFGTSRPEGVTDFNDLVRLRGEDAVKRAIAAVSPAGLDQHLVNIDDLTNCDDPLPHYVDRWIPENQVTLLAGHGGGGKSYVALILAVCVALGLPFAGLVTKQANTLFYSAEDGEQVLRKRLSRICRALAIEVASLKGKLHLLDASDLDPALHREQRVNGGRPSLVFETPMLAAVADLVKRLDAGLIVIDNASDAYDDDEIMRARVRTFIRSLRLKIARPGRAVLLLAHVNKASAAQRQNAGSEDYSGSTQWHNGVRSRLSLTSAEPNTLTIQHAKANFGPKADPVTLEWHDGVPVVAGTHSTQGAELAKELVRKDDLARDEKAKSALVELIKSFDARGELVSTSATGPATAFKLLKGEPGFPKNVGRDRLMPLFRQLQDEGRIYRRAVRTPNRKWKEVFTCTPAPETAPMPDPRPDAAGTRKHDRAGQGVRR